MARYYDTDKLKEMIEAKADTLIEGKEAFLYVAKWLDLLPPTDVVPKSEVEQFITLNSQLEAKVFEERKAKTEVAREIFEEIERLAMSKIDTNLSVAVLNDTYYIEAIDELKKKYTEGTL